MLHTFVVRLGELLHGFTRVTFTGCAGDPGVWEQAAIQRARERRAERAMSPGDAGSSRTLQTARPDRDQP